MKKFLKEGEVPTACGKIQVQIKKASVPYWGNKDLKIGTVRNIIRQLEIDYGEFKDV